MENDVDDVACAGPAKSIKNRDMLKAFNGNEQRKREQAEWFQQINDNPKLEGQFARHFCEYYRIPLNQGPTPYCVLYSMLAHMCMGIWKKYEQDIRPDQAIGTILSCLWMDSAEFDVDEAWEKWNEKSMLEEARIFNAAMKVFFHIQIKEVQVYARDDFDEVLEEQRRRAVVGESVIVVCRMRESTSAHAMAGYDVVEVDNEEVLVCRNSWGDKLPKVFVTRKMFERAYTAEVEIVCVGAFEKKVLVYGTINESDFWGKNVALYRLLRLKLHWLNYLKRIK